MFDTPTPTSLEVRVAQLEAELAAARQSSAADAATLQTLIDGLAAVRAAGDEMARAQLRYESGGRQRGDQANNDLTGDMAVRLEQGDRLNRDRLDLATYKAETGAGRAELAAVQALFKGPIHPTIADGLPTVEEGETFAVEGAALDDEQLPTDFVAPLNSPEFTGTPTAPTAPRGNNSNRLATTAFVKKDIALWMGAGINLLRDIDVTTLLMTVQRRGLSDDNAMQSAVVMGDYLYTLHEAGAGTLGVICRVPFDDAGPACVAADSAMNGSALIGHQGIEAYVRPDGATKLLVTARADGKNFLMGSYNAAGDFVSDGSWTMFGPEFSLNPTYTMPHLSEDGSLLLCRAKWPNGDTLIRFWDASATLAAPGDYKDSWLDQITIPLADLGARPLQDFSFAQGSLIAVAGYGQFGTDSLGNPYGPEQRTLFLQYALDGTRIGRVERDFADFRDQDAAGASGLCEPESYIRWRSKDGRLRWGVLMATGGTGYRNSRFHLIGSTRRVEAERRTDRLQAALLSGDFGQRLTFDQQAVMTGFYRSLIMDGLLDRAGYLYPLCGRNIGLGERFARTNLIAPERDMLVRNGATLDPFASGFYVPNGIDDWLDTGVPWDFLAAYLRRIGEVAVYCTVNMQHGGAVIGSNPTGSSFTYLRPRSDSNAATARSQYAYISEAPNNLTIAGITDSRGLWSLRRTAETAWDVLRNGVVLGSASNPTSGTPGVATLAFGCSSSTFSAQPLAMAYVGEPLSDALEARMRMHIEDLLAAMRVVL